MTTRLTPSQILQIIRDGPASQQRLTADQVRFAATKWPEKFDRALVRLYFFMLQTQYKAHGRHTITRYERFVRPWREAVDRKSLEYFTGTVDAYVQAVKLGFHHLDWETPVKAREIAAGIRHAMPSAASITGLPWRLLLAQVESTYSRTDAAATFAQVREHESVSLVPFFYWDTGGLTYYSDAEIKARKVALPSLSQMQTWQAGEGDGSDKAIVISMDPRFFRIYGPMILFNAQQLPAIDFVILLCTTPETAEALHSDAGKYLEALGNLNGQAAPKNLTFRSVTTPSWVGNEVTFYACARFLALPELLEQYENVYAMDADLFMIRDPLSFIASSASNIVSFPKTPGLLGVPPWRRFMAGNFMVNRKAASSDLLRRHLDYLSVGLTEGKSWMLDQNALSYAVEGADDKEYTPMRDSRPNLSGTIMAKWEQNFKAALAQD